MVGKPGTTFLPPVMLLTLLVALLAGGCGPRTATDPAEQLRIGWNRFRVSEFDQAAAAFEKARDSTSPDSPLHAQALYGLASTWHLRRPGDDRPHAKALYEQVVALTPKSDEAAWSLLALARLKHVPPVGQEPDLEEVRRAYQEVIDRFPGHLAGHEAFLHQQATRVAAYRPEEAWQVLATIDAFIKRYPDSRFLSPLYDLESLCHFVLDEPEKRLAAELRSLENREMDPTNPNMDNAAVYWTVACVAQYEVGDFATARKFYKLLLEEYPADVRSFGAKQALKGMDELEAKIRSETAARKPAAGGAP
jgi:tetratricopeptide (TPR) repeat protein